MHHEHGNAASAVEPLANRGEQPAAPVGLSDDHEVPAAGARLAKQSGSGAAAGHQLRYRDVLWHQPRGFLDVALRPAKQILLEAVPAHGQYYRAGRRQRRSARGAAQDPQPPVAGLSQLDGPRKRFPGEHAAVHSDEDSMEHRGSLILSLLSKRTTIS
jgi:hypothetical protein